MLQTAAAAEAASAPYLSCLSPRPARLHTHTIMPSTLQDDDIPGIVRFRTYEVLKEEVANPRLRWAYLPYSMHMAGPREAIQHMIIRRNYGGLFPGTASRLGGQAHTHCLLTSSEASDGTEAACLSSGGCADGGSP